MTIAESLQRSVEALEHGATDEALRRVEDVLRAHPQLSVAHLVRARALLEAERAGEALEAARAAVRLAPDSAEAHATLGAAHLAAGRIDLSRAAFERALELAPDSASVQARFAALLLEAGELALAEPLFAAATRNGSTSALAGWITLRERRGDAAGALELLERVAEPSKAPIEVQIAAARVLRRSGRIEDAVTLLRALDPRRLTAAQRVATFHALGDALDELGDANAAFDAWKRANDARGSTFDAATLRERVASLRRDFTRESFAELPRTRLRDERPVFVLGAPRSGTSLVEHMLAAHPQVAGAGELDDFPQLVAGLEHNDVDALDRVAARYSARLDAVDPGALRITDKLPHNAFHLGRIAQCCPSARVVYVRRDPLDVGLSIFSRNFHATHDYATDLAAIGVFLREYEALMEHWKQHAPLPIFEVRYEELVREPERRAKELLAFLGLAWDPSVLRFHESRREVHTASYAQVRQPLYTRSIGRARAFAERLEPLRRALDGASTGRAFE